MDPEQVNLGTAVRETQRFSCQCIGACAGSSAIVSNGQLSRAIVPDTTIRRAFEDPDSVVVGKGSGQSLESILDEFLGIAIHSIAVSYSAAPGPMPETLCQDGGTTDITIAFAYNAGDLPLLEFAPGLTDTSGAATAAITAISDGTATAPCSNRGVCGAGAGCSCSSGYASSDGNGGSGMLPDCGFRSPGGQCPENAEGDICSGHGACSGAPAFECTCESGYQGADCSEFVCPFGTAWWQTPTSSTFSRTLDECSAKGVCNRATGICQCQHGYEGEACQRKTCVVSNFKPCSGLGRCVPLSEIIEAGTVQGKRLGTQAVQTFYCKLDASSASSDQFSLVLGHQESPSIKASSSEQSVRRALQKLHSAGKVRVSFNAGQSATACDSTTAVEVEITFLDAVGTVPPLQVVDIVSGGGAANGMSATNAGFGATDFTVTSEAAGSLLLYGKSQTAALQADMWDASMLYGCMCDGYAKAELYSDAGDGGKYKGPECQLQNCPTGADPHQLYTSTRCSSYTTLLHAENATLSCAASAGTFTLEFRGQETGPISHSASVLDLESSLEALSTIRDVTITSSSATICSGSPTETLITFADPPGNVPDLIADTRRLVSTTFTIVHTDAPGLLAECGGRGVCDEIAGICKCHTGYASSNGFGGIGTRGDCGHLLEASEIRKVSQATWQDTWRTEV